MIGAGCQEELLHDLPELEANKVMMNLHKTGIEAKKEKQANGSWTVVVASSDAIRAMKELSNRRLLSKAPQIKTSANSMFQSRDEQKQLLEKMLGHEIEYTLLALPGVLDARVHLNMPFRDPLAVSFAKVESSGSASVLLIVDKGVHFSETDIQSLVSGASGILPEKVMLLHSEVIPSYTGEDSLLAISDPQLTVSPVLVNADMEHHATSASSMDSPLLTDRLIRILTFVGLLVFSYGSISLRRLLRRRRAIRAERLFEDGMREGDSYVS
jgi:type III secretory pathway lipoprotein EscJ